ncbi:MAG TPA: fibronectin type III domain-containing protein, partial [Acidimicrobiia bacterium]|nr:fibronectin type III domain-containing protein [Acidimicrobiia bacterium]
MLVALMAATVGMQPAGATTDTALQQFSMSTTSVDTTSASATITVTARFTSSYSFSDAYFDFYSPSQNQDVEAYFSSGNRRSGTVYDGTYQTTVTIPAGSESGTWKVLDGSSEDIYGYYRDYYYSDLVNAGFPASFTDTGTSDATAPAVQSFAMSTTSVNTAASSASITVTARITDNASGFYYGYLYFYSPSGDDDVAAYFSSGNRISGSSLDGTYRTTITIPQGSENGTWTLQSSSFLSDQLYNYRYYSSTDFVNAGFPASFTNRSDVNAPVLTLFSMSTTAVDTVTGPATITVTARITDDASGFSSGDFPFDSPSGNSDADAYFSSGNRISGTNVDGTYRTTMTIAQGSESGTWSMSSGSVQDQASNSRSYSYSDFVNAGFPASFTNTSAKVPGAPTNVVATPGDKSASVSWTPPANNGSSISSYTVTAAPGGAYQTVTGAQTSASVTGLTDGTSYTFTVIATNGVGTGPASTPSNAVTPSGPPAVDIPFTSFAVGSKVSTTSIPVIEQWPAASDPTGICKYDLRESIAGGAFNEVTLPSPTSRSVSLSLKPETEYSFELNVTNCAGQSSGWGVEPSFASLPWQESSPKLKYSGAWSTRSKASAYGGAVKYATNAGASATEKFFASSVTWVSATGPTMGKATVYVDGVAAKTVNLYSGTAHAGQMVWKQGWSTQGQHTIKIVVLGTKGHAEVDVD